MRNRKARTKNDGREDIRECFLSSPSLTQRIGVGAHHQDIVTTSPLPTDFPPPLLLRWLEDQAGDGSVGEPLLDGGGCRTGWLGGSEVDEVDDEAITGGVE